MKFKSKNYVFSRFFIILTTLRKDTHQDHRVVNELAFSLARQNNIGLVEYMTPNTELDWASNLFIDIKDHYCHKKIPF
jgi:LmbE family N-acetylglucosaminyl deacetylase